MAEVTVVAVAGVRYQTSEVRKLLAHHLGLSADAARGVASDINTGSSVRLESSEAAISALAAEVNDRFPELRLSDLRS